MTAFFITLDGLLWLLAAFAVYCLVLLFLGILGVVWLLRPGWRRGAGGLLLVALASYGAGPTVYETLRGNRLGAQMAAASFWPEDVQFEGTRVLLVASRWHSCDNLCQTLLERGDVAEVYIVGLTDEAMGAPLTAEVLRGPDTSVQRAFLEQVAEDMIEGGVTVASTQTAPLPETVDWIFVVDIRGLHAQAHGDAIDLEPGALDRTARALHLYEVQDARLAPTLEATAVARMMAGQRLQRPYFMPLVRNTQLSNDTGPFSDALEAWICGPIAPDAQDRCRYMF